MNASDLLKGNLATGVVVGIGLVALAPVLAPALSGSAQPLLKSLVKTGLLALEKGREALAEAGEALEDLVAEAAAELAEEESARTNGGAASSRSRVAARH